MYEIERIAIEVASTVACFILVRFRIKPFRLTGKFFHFEVHHVNEWSLR
jgi:hypothetical protein